MIEMEHHHPADEALDAARLAAFTAQIEQQLQFRREQLEEQEVDPGVETEADRAVRRALERGAIAALTEIVAARDRLAEGRFGWCIDCGAGLPIERLEALPWVPRCLTCHHAAASEQLR